MFASAVGGELRASFLYFLRAPRGKPQHHVVLLSANLSRVKVDQSYEMRWISNCTAFPAFIEVISIGVRCHDFAVIILGFVAGTVPF